MPTAQNIQRSSMKVSIRVLGKVTSFTLRKDIVSLWIVLNNLEEAKRYRNEVIDFSNQCLVYWNKDTGKGFSEFITTHMIQDILEKGDFNTYKQVFQKLV